MCSVAGMGSVGGWVELVVGMKVMVLRVKSGSRGVGGGEMFGVSVGQRQQGFGHGVLAWYLGWDW